MKKTLPTRVATHTDQIKVVQQRTLPEKHLWNRTGYRFLGTVIFISLIAMLGLLSQHRARSAGGPIPVQVTNDPLATTDTSVTGAQEYLVQSSVSIPNSSADGFTSVTVPMGKRLIVETVSIFRSGSGLTTQSVQGYIGRHDTLSGDFALPVVAPSSTASPGSTLAMRCYFDPGSTIYLASHRSGTSGAETDVVTISGYLVNVP